MEAATSSFQILVVNQTTYHSSLYGLHTHKAEAIPVTVHGGPQGCETSRLPHFLDNQLTDDGEVVSLTRLPHLYPQEDSWYSFPLEAES
jgi:hypothetical protein